MPSRLSPASSVKLVLSPRAAAGGSQPCVQCLKQQPSICRAAYADVVCRPLLSPGCAHGPFCPRCQQAIATRVLPACVCRALVSSWREIVWPSSTAVLKEQAATEASSSQGGPFIGPALPPQHVRNTQTTSTPQVQNEEKAKARPITSQQRCVPIATRVSSNASPPSGGKVPLPSQVAAAAAADERMLCETAVGAAIVRPSVGLSSQAGTSSGAANAQFKRRSPVENTRARVRPRIDATACAHANGNVQDGAAEHHPTCADAAVVGLAGPSVQSRNGKQSDDRGQSANARRHRITAGASDDEAAGSESTS